ncbi:MAG: hypothetical protein RJB66_2705 [Pseudomonadota bacterium]
MRLVSIFVGGFLSCSVALFARSANAQSFSEQTPSEINRSVEKTFTTKESTVEIQGRKFRKIQIQKESYYIETVDSKQANADIRVLCQQGQSQFLPNQAEVGVKTGKRSAVVIEGIRQVCKEAQGGRREIALDPALMAGLQLQVGKEKNKKIIVSPIGLTFKADW